MLKIQINWQNHCALKNEMMHVESKKQIHVYNEIHLNFRLYLGSLSDYRIIDLIIKGLSIFIPT